MKLQHVLPILLLSQSVMANSISIVGSIPVNIENKNTNLQLSLKKSPKIHHTIKLMKIELSESALQNIVKKSQNIASHADGEFSVTNLKPSWRRPQSIALGMNNVPVLDQGAQGTCTTFAITAAIDAALGKGDYVSQLCQLQLGNYFEENAYSVSGWDGQFLAAVISGIDLNGFISKTNQLQNGCGGVTEYPMHGEAPKQSINPADFHMMSEPFTTLYSKTDSVKFGWSSIFNIYQLNDKYIDHDAILDQVKQALVAGDRIPFGVMIVDYRLGVVGALGTNKTNNDTWVLTNEIMQDIQNYTAEYAGHAMIITGYDDNAVAIDDEGKEHKGLLTLRNSWGAKAGDNGDYYMSYDYFSLLMDEAYRARTLKRLQ